MCESGLRSLGLVMALAPVAACSDPPLYIRITELRMEPAVVSRDYATVELELR
jgi:hypothetical protein